MVKHTLKILRCEHGMIPKVYLTIFQHHVGKCLEINCLGKNWIQSFILYRDYVGSCFEKKIKPAVPHYPAIFSTQSSRFQVFNILLVNHIHLFDLIISKLIKNINSREISSFYTNVVNH